MIGSSFTNNSWSQDKHIADIHSRIRKREFIILIAAIMAVGAVAIDIMLPAMDHIKEDLHANGMNDHQYIIFFYLCGFGGAHLIFGPISDSFGRRVPLIIGLFLYAFSSLACAFSSSFSVLLALRFIQGIGGASARVITISLIRDLYQGRQMAEIMSIIMMIFMIIPVIAPGTGQILLHFGSWPWIFLFMFITGLTVAFWSLLRLPETLFIKRPLTFFSIKDGFKQAISNRFSICYTLALSVLLGSLFGSLNTAQQIYDGIYHLDRWFPLAFAVVALFQALASLSNALFVGRFGMRKISHFMLFCYIVTSCIWFFWSLLEVVPFPAHMILFSVIMFSFGTIGANFSSLAMEPLGDIAGTASSIFGFLQVIIGAGLGIVIGQSFNDSTLPISIGFLCCGFLSLLLVLLAEDGKLFISYHQES